MSSLYIYTGPWINYSRNIFFGATITLTTQYGAVLIALLATLVAAAGVSSWAIIKYFLHQFRSNRGTNDAIFYQQQAILKNSETALGSAWKFVQVSWSWRNHERRKIWRSWTLLLVVTTILLSVVFGAAAIFSSQVSQAASTAFLLLHSPNCGLWIFRDPITALERWDNKLLNDSLAAANYAKNCYGNGNRNNRLCEIFAVSEISWNTAQNVSCPFGNGACANSNTSAYQMDTGPLDSHEIFGINAKLSERVVIRKVSTCAPIRLRPYSVIVNRTVGPVSQGTRDPFVEIHMGGTVGRNWTYEYNLHTIYSNIGYDLQTIYSPAAMIRGWVPIPDFDRMDADVSLFFLALNSVSYLIPNEDYFFQATSKFTLGNVTRYFPDYRIAALGCTDQYQACNPASPGPNGEQMRCGPLSSLAALSGSQFLLGFNDYQNATMWQLFVGLLYSNMNSVVDGRGASALKAQATVFNLLQLAPIPENQWQIELDGWFAASLARLQQAIVEYAAGPENVVNQGGSIVVPKGINDSESICKRQMIRNASGYQNFSMLGVAIILVVSTILILLGWTIDICIGAAQHKLRRHNARLSWVEDGYLQLQRMAYEGAGYNGWRDCVDEVPLTSRREREAQQLGGLDLADLNHPKLVPPRERIARDHQFLLRKN